MSELGGPRRVARDHVHEGIWTTAQQHRFEDRVGDELEGLRADVRKIADRVTLLIGGVALLAFILPIVAPFIRSVIGLP